MAKLNPFAVAQKRAAMKTEEANISAKEAKRPAEESQNKRFVDE